MGACYFCIEGILVMKKIFASASVAMATLALLVFAISFLSTPPLASADVFSEVCIDDSAANNNPNDSAVCQGKQSPSQ